MVFCKKKNLNMVTGCTAFEIIDSATLDDGKLRVLKSDSHQYVVTCTVSFEFKLSDVSEEPVT